MRGLTILLAIFLCLGIAQAASNNWSGANSYFIWALNDQDRIAHLDALKNAKINVIRIFVAVIGQGAKGSSASFVADLEEYNVGSYQNDILNRIDKLMYECSQRGLKLNIALHDRYSTGWWANDAYSRKYPGGKNPIQFYTDGNAQKDFDNRLRYLLTHKNPLLGNRPWGELTEAVWAFGVENEAMAYMSGWSNPWTWHCNHAKVMRSLINKNIFITTGGGANWDDSLQVNNFKCPYIDVIGIHSYNGVGELRSKLGYAIQLAKSNNKRIIYEEFGNENNQPYAITSEADYCNQMGVPWFPWQFIHANPGNLEYWLGSDAWKIHVSKNAAAFNSRSAFNWTIGATNSTTGDSIDDSIDRPGNDLSDGLTSASSAKDCQAKCLARSDCTSFAFDKCGTACWLKNGNPGTTPNSCRSSGVISSRLNSGGGDGGGGNGGGNGGSGLGDWEMCSVSSQCTNGCCSKEYSNDGQLKCTPGGKQCVSASLSGDWVQCQSSSECSNKCCSKEYSDDGQLKCTPGGKQCN